MLSSMAELGYMVEWRVVNAADYGYPQKRRRVFIVARRSERFAEPTCTSADIVYQDGVLARALPVRSRECVFEGAEPPHFVLADDVAEVSEEFGRGMNISPFRTAGVMIDRRVWTYSPMPQEPVHRETLGEILVSEDQVPPEFFVRSEQLESWRYLKGAKSERRTHEGSGSEYRYSEGALPFPDHQSTGAYHLDG